MPDEQIAKLMDNIDGMLAMVNADTDYARGYRDALVQVKAELESARA